MTYSNLLRANVDGLKKTDEKSKSKRSKAAQSVSPSPSCFAPWNAYVMTRPLS
uniref:Uncharacterized protein n=1 Tax=Canis lupus dingo TaxID=286419 RepID=A0A8C0LE19_CANLU